MPKCLSFTGNNDYTIISQKERIFRMTARFEWDEEKNRANKRKHGISFETAAYVFEDEHHIEMYNFGQTSYRIGKGALL